MLLDFDFDEEEQGLSVAVLKIGIDESESFVVGAATVLSDEIQAKRGRLLLWQHQESGFEQVTNYDARGSPYAIAQMPKGRLAIAVNASVCCAKFKLGLETHRSSRYTSWRRRKPTLLNYSRNGAVLS